MTSENTEAVAGQATADRTSAMGVHTLLSQEQANEVAKAAGAKQGHGDLGLVPVMMFGAAPPWPPLAKPGARRPVVAVPDSGVQSHPWLTGRPGDPIVRHATEFDWPDSPIPVTSNLPPYYQGHATFVAGVIRQTAPAARILSVPVMGTDGRVTADASNSALGFLHTLLTSGKPEQFVDVVCLAYGYEEDEPGPDPRTGQMRDALHELSHRGVLIVTSAGNNGEEKPPTYPAAFAGEHNPPVISVGAANPDGSYADYSNHGSWVTYRAIGSGVISTIAEYDGDTTLPIPPDPSATPPPVVPPPFPQTVGVPVDPYNFPGGGFARWSGTSFSAARVAGLLAHALSSDPNLADLSAGAALARAKSALAAIEPNRRKSTP